MGARIQATHGEDCDLKIPPGFNEWCIHSSETLSHTLYPVHQQILPLLLTSPAAWSTPPVSLTWLIAVAS